MLQTHLNRIWDHLAHQAAIIANMATSLQTDIYLLKDNALSSDNQTYEYYHTYYKVS